MGSYRQSRNLESSIIDYLTTEFSVDWSNVNCEKTFARVYDLDLPTVCVRLGQTIHNRAEIGDTGTYREAQILIDIFATSDGQRLDLKDYIVDKVKDGFIYYEYIISGGSVQSKTANGRIRVMTINDNPVSFDADKDNLDIHDRYRHLITLTVWLGRIES